MTGIFRITWCLKFSCTISLSPNIFGKHCELKYALIIKVLKIQVLLDVAPIAW
jgi:hypothetical protein